MLRLLHYCMLVNVGSPLPPTSLTFIPSDTSISLIWSHSDECFENCTFMYEVTWQQSGDGSSLGNTTTAETSYTIEGLTSGTSYEIGVGAYCEEDPNIRSDIDVIMFLTTLPGRVKLITLGVNYGMHIILNNRCFKAMHRSSLDGHLYAILLKAQLHFDTCCMAFVLYKHSLVYIHTYICS